MTRTLRSVHQRPRRRPRTGARPCVELLEVRALPAAPSWTSGLSALAEQENHSILQSNNQPFPGGNDNLVNAQALTWRTSTGRTPGPWALVQGYLGDGVSGAADVDFYSFTLANAATVTVTTFDTPGSSATTVLSLYNSDPNSLAINGNGTANDPYDRTGHLLLAQAVGSSADGGASITRKLAAGTYYVAVSGAGNQYFQPFVPQSGDAGSRGNYGLAITETNLPSTVGPTVIASNPAQNAVLASSPLVLRIDLNSGLDPNSITTQNIQLINTSLPSSDPNYSPALAVNFSPDTNELQLTPQAPLQKGHYQLILKGTGSAPLLDPTDNFALGQTTRGALGTDFILNFRVQASAASTDTAATAVNLGDVTNGRLVQHAGVIGDDPFYSFFDPNNPGVVPNNFAGAEVDMYHFHISGAGNYVLQAEVFAGRIGSPLDSGLSLFRQDASGHLVPIPIAANDNTANGITATDGVNYFDVPLYNDSALTAGLTAGDYILAVSSGANTPDPLLNRTPGQVIQDPFGLNDNGQIFDPNVSHSGQSGTNNFMNFTTGPYLLQFKVSPNPGAPHVVSVSPAPGSVLNGAPTTLVVKFDQAVDVQQLAYQAYLQTHQQGMSPIFVRGADGHDYYPRLLSYDTSTDTATLQMLDSLPNGVNTLHISGPLGLTNLGGTPLVGNDPSGDYVVRFTVTHSSGGSGGANTWIDVEPNNSLGTAQNLGTLFPASQLQAGITITRDFSGNPGVVVSDTGDYYQFTVTQARQYSFTLFGSGLPAGVAPVVTNLSGVVESGTPSFLGGAVTTATLSPGTYVVSVSGWTPAQAPGVKYQLRISFGQWPENPTPLTVGAAPALSIRLVNSQPPPILPPLPPTPTNNAGLELAGLGSLLARGPVGGITGGNGELGVSAPGVTVAAQTSPFSLVHELVQLAILSQLDVGGIDDLDVGSPAGTPGIDTNAGPLWAPWPNTLDSLFRTSDWLDVPTEPSLRLAPQPAEEFQDFDVHDSDQDAAAVVDDSFADPSFLNDGAWVSAVAALALFQGELAQRRRAARKPERVTR